MPPETHISLMLKALARASVTGHGRQNTTSCLRNMSTVVVTLPRRILTVRASQRTLDTYAHYQLVRCVRQNTYYLMSSLQIEQTLATARAAADWDREARDAVSGRHARSARCQMAG